MKVLQWWHSFKASCFFNVSLNCEWNETKNIKRHLWQVVLYKSSWTSSATCIRFLALWFAEWWVLNILLGFVDCSCNSRNAGVQHWEHADGTHWQSLCQHRIRWKFQWLCRVCLWARQPEPWMPQKRICWNCTGHSLRRMSQLPACFWFSPLDWKFDGMSEESFGLVWDQMQ